MSAPDELDVLERWKSVRLLNRSERPVAIFTACVAGLSALMVLLLLSHILVVGLLPYIRRGSKYSSAGERAFLWRPIGALVTSLLLCNLLQATSGLFQSHWAHIGQVHTGVPCTAQAVLILSGDVGVSLFNMLVAAHTFTTVCLHKSWSSLALSLLIALAWLLALVIALLGPFALQTPERGPFYGISNSWCFINNNYSADRLYLQYVAILVSASVILVLYVLVFLTIRSKISIYGWSLRFACDAPATYGGAFGEPALHIPSPALAHTANQMLWYPAAYIILILPLLTARICAQRGEHVPRWVSSVALVFLYLTGLVNVVIYSATRRALSPIHWPRRASATSTCKLRVGSTDPHVACVSYVHCARSAPNSVCDVRTPDRGSYAPTPPLSPTSSRPPRESDDAKSVSSLRDADEAV